jgi:NAD-dependent deacetylase
MTFYFTYTRDTCELRDQLRPHIVWFGELIIHHDEARAHIKDAARILVVGTSLVVYPAAGLLKKASFHAEKILVSLDIDKKPYGYKFVRAKATKVVPLIVERWLKGERAV